MVRLLTYLPRQMFDMAISLSEPCNAHVPNGAVQYKNEAELNSQPWRLILYLNATIFKSISLVCPAAKCICIFSCDFVRHFLSWLTKHFSFKMLKNDVRITFLKTHLCFIALIEMLCFMHHYHQLCKLGLIIDNWKL